MKPLHAETAERRANFIQTIETPPTVTMLRGMIESLRTAGDMFPGTENLGTGENAARTVARNLRQMAEAAESWTITPEMFDIVQHAAKALPPQEIQPFDLPSPTGWLHLPTPFTTEDVRGKEVAITDIMWHTSGDSLILHSCVEQEPPDDPFWQRPGIPQKTVALYTATTPKASIVHSTQMPFGQTAWTYTNATGDGTRGAHDTGGLLFGRNYRSTEKILQKLGTPIGDPEPNGSQVFALPDGTLTHKQPAAVVQLLKAYWHFTSSNLTERDTPAVPRALMKQMRRTGVPDTPVTVVRLKQRTMSRGTGQGWQLEHRYVRRGHWRNQWFGPLDGYRYQRHIWIDPTVCGPEDAPLHVRDAVKIVTR